MNFGKVAALTVLLVGSLALDTVATAQELFGVHVIAVNRFHSPVEITEFIFGKGDNSLRGPKIVVANHSKKVVTGYGLELVYLASQGCNVKGTSVLPILFLKSMKPILPATLAEAASLLQANRRSTDSMLGPNNLSRSCGVTNPRIFL